MDITAERQAEEAQQEPQESLRSHLTPEQEVFQRESDERLQAAMKRLAELSKKLPPDKQYGIPANAQLLATVNAMLQVMLERGILSPVELELRGGRCFVDVIEEAVQHAEADAAERSDIWTPDQAVGAPPPPPRNRKERRHPPS